MNGEYDPDLRYVETEFLERRSMPVPPWMLTLAFELIKDLVLDDKQSLKAEHVEKAMDKKFDSKAMEVVNQLINDDKSHSFKNLTDFLKG